MTRLQVGSAVTLGDAVVLGMLLPYLPFVVIDMGGGAEMVALLASCFGVSAWAGSPVLGWLCDRAGRRTVILASLFISAVAYLGMLVFWSIPAIFGFQALAGLMVGRDAAVRALVVSGEAPDRHPRIVGTVTGLGAVGSILGPLLAALVALAVDETMRHGVILGFVIVVHALCGGLGLLALEKDAPPKARPSGNGAPAWERITPMSDGVRRPLLLQGLVSFAWGVLISTITVLVHVRFSWSEVEMSGIMVVIALATIASRLVVMPRAISAFGLGPTTVGATVVCVPALAITGLPGGVSAFWAGLVAFVMSVNILMTVPTLLITQDVPSRIQGSALGFRQSVSSMMVYGVAGLHGWLFARFGPASPYLLGAVLLCAFPLLLADSHGGSASRTKPES